MPEKFLTMKLLKEKYGVCSLNKEDAIPEWAQCDQFYSITKTMDELSVVCPQDCIPGNIKCEKEWRIIKVEGPLDFSLIGILASISTILANKGISIFAVSTYDTDYILVKEKDITSAIDALTAENYKILS